MKETMELNTNNLAESKDYNDFFAKLENAGIMLSTLMMDMLQPLDLGKEDMETKKFWLTRFIEYQRITEGLGMLEHTGDWDPNIIIKLTDGTHFESATGYSEMRLNDDYLLIDGPDELDEEIDDAQFWDQTNLLWRLPITRIKTIQLSR